MTLSRPTSALKQPLASPRWLNHLVQLAALVLAVALNALCLSPAALAEATSAGNNSSIGTAAWIQQGKASYYYGPRWHGGPTASGERYDENSMTAAHKTLPMDTLVEVTREDTGAKVIVRINNRGPYIRGRVIDLSKAAAQKLKMTNIGVAKVSLRILPGKGANPAAIEEAMAVREAEIKKINQKYALTLASFESKDEAKRFRLRMQAVEVDKTIVKRVKEEGEVKYEVEIPGFHSEAEARQERDAISKKVLEQKPGA